MLIPSEALRIYGIAGTVLIGPAASFPSGEHAGVRVDEAPGHLVAIDEVRWHQLPIDEARRLLRQILVESRRVEALRSYWSQWRLWGDDLRSTSDAALIDRVMLERERGRISVWLLPYPKLGSGGVTDGTAGPGVSSPRPLPAQRLARAEPESANLVRQNRELAPPQAVDTSSLLSGLLAASVEQAAAQIAAAKSGAPFCEICSKKKSQGDSTL